MNSPKTPTSKTKKKYRKTTAEMNAEGRERKSDKKHRGNKSGSRNQEKSSGGKNNGQNNVADPRLGSKKPVALIVDENQVKATPVVPKQVAVKEKISPEQELEMLESDDRLDGLLARLEDGETITEKEQKYIDTCLDRIDELMKQLGIEFSDEDESEEEEEKLDDIMRILKSK